MKFKKAKKLIDKYFGNLKPGELVESAKEFGLSVKENRITCDECGRECRDIFYTYDHTLCINCYHKACESSVFPNFRDEVFKALKIPQIAEWLDNKLRRENDTN